MQILYPINLKTLGGGKMSFSRKHEAGIQRQKAQKVSRAPSSKSQKDPAKSCSLKERARLEGWGLYSLNAAAREGPGDAAWGNKFF